MDTTKLIIMAVVAVAVIAAFVVLAVFDKVSGGVVVTAIGGVLSSIVAYLSNSPLAEKTD